MASFAKLNSDNVVVRVESVNNEVLQDANGVEQESLGIEFLRTLYQEPNGNWKQTSYSGSIRKNHAGVGYTYDENRDAFIPPKPFNSWVFNENTCNWEAPVQRPTDGYNYNWNETTQSWQ